MKKSLRNVLVCLSLLVAASVYGAGMPPLSVTVTDAAGHAAYKGKTNADGTFATGKLPGGDYVVQFSSEGAPAGNYALVISAGKQKVMAQAVPGTKFTKGGVAMRINVGKDLNVAGQVSSGKAELEKTVANTRVKVINGKRYVWVSGTTGSNLGGHWAEEGSVEAQNVQRVNKDAVNRVQERGAAGLSGN